MKKQPIGLARYCLPVSFLLALGTTSHLFSITGAVDVIPGSGQSTDRSLESMRWDGDIGSMDPEKKPERAKTKCHKNEVRWHYETHKRWKQHAGGEAKELLKKYRRMAAYLPAGPEKDKIDRLLVKLRDLKRRERSVVDEYKNDIPNRLYRIEQDLKFYFEEVERGKK